MQDSSVRSIREIGLLLRRAEVIVQQVVYHQADGIHGALRLGGMSADAITGDAYTVTLGSDLHILGFLKSGDVCLHQRRSTVRHHIAGYTALAKSRRLPESFRLTKAPPKPPFSP